MFYTLKESKHAQLIFQKLIQIVKKQIMLLMTPNEGKEECHYLAVEKLSALLHRITSKHKGDFIA